MSAFKEIITLLEGGFESSSGKTPEFSAFARKFKAKMKKELKSKGAELVEFSVGHFYCSGYYKFGDKEYFFSISDVRSGRDRFLGDIMFRKQPMDSRSTGSNNWGSFDDDKLIDKMISL